MMTSKRRSPAFHDMQSKKASCLRRSEKGRFTGGYVDSAECQQFSSQYGAARRSVSPRRRSVSPHRRSVSPVVSGYGRRTSAARKKAECLRRSPSGQIVGRKHTPECEASSSSSSSRSASPARRSSLVRRRSASYGRHKYGDADKMVSFGHGKDYGHYDGYDYGHRDGEGYGHREGYGHVYGHHEGMYDRRRGY